MQVVLCEDSDSVFSTMDWILKEGVEIFGVTDEELSTYSYMYLINEDIACTKSMMKILSEGSGRRKDMARELTTVLAVNLFAPELCRDSFMLTLRFLDFIFSFADTLYSMRKGRDEEFELPVPENPENCEDVYGVSRSVISRNIRDLNMSLPGVFFDALETLFPHNFLYETYLASIFSRPLHYTPEKGMYEIPFRDRPARPKAERDYRRHIRAYVASSMTLFCLLSDEVEGLVPKLRIKTLSKPKKGKEELYRLQKEFWVEKDKEYEENYRKTV